MGVDLYIVGCFILLVFYMWLKKQSYHGQTRNPPGPKGHLFIGSALEISPETMHERFFSYTEQFGNIFQVKIFNSKIVCLNSSELVRKAFSEEPYKRVMNDRDSFFFSDYVHYGAQTIGAIHKGSSPLHSGLRKGYTKAFHVYGDGTETFEKKVSAELLRFSQEIDSFNGHGFDFQALLKKSLSNLISILMIGEDVSDDNDKIFWEYDRSTNFLINPTANIILSTFPFLRFVPGTYMQAFKEIVAAKKAIEKKYVEEPIKTYQPGTIRGIIDSLYSQYLADKDAGREPVYNYERISCAAMETIGAGILTSFATLSNLLVCLLHHPEYQLKIQRELDEVVGRDRLPTITDRGKCPWLEAVLMESLRLIPTNPLLAPHHCYKDVEFEGYRIDTNTTIVANLWYIHHDPKVWEDPWTFRPERFLNEEDHLIPMDHRFRRNWFPFGIGRRQCVGEPIARSRMFLYLATLLQRWTFVQVPGEVGSCDPRRSDSFGVHLMMIAKPFICKVVERET